MDLRVHPKPEIEVKLACKGIVSREEYFVEKQYEKINQYFFPGHLIRKWRPKAELIYPPVPDENVIQYECDFNRDVQSCFVEDYAEEVYLRSPPPCFVIFGKHTLEVVKLGKQIADEFESVLINVDNIVNQIIKTDIQSAKFLDKVLRVGVAITLNFVLALLSYIVHTPEVRHRGYVLCGLPCFSYLHDLSAEQQFDYLFSWDNKPTVFINIDFDDEDLVTSRTNTRCQLTRVGHTTNITIHVGSNQMDEEEEEEEDDDDDYYYDEYEDDEEQKEEVQEEVEEEEEEEEEEDENEDEYEGTRQKHETEEALELGISPSRPWVQLPRDEESEVWTELEFYETKIKPVLDLIKSRVDPQYYITVDSRLKNSFQIIRARLGLLQIWKSPTPFPFYNIKEKPKKIKSLEREGELEYEGEEEEEELEEEEEETEDEEIMAVIEDPPQTAFLTLFSKKTLSPKFRWELSHYNYMCPVSLRDGLVLEGKTKYAVVFLKYIYFLHDNERMQKFLKNPRPYVLPVRPRPCCRFIILGYPFSGRTTLAESLSDEFSIPIIDVADTLKRDLALKKSVYLDFCRQKAEAREIIRLTALAWQNWRNEEEQRINLIEKWIGYIQCLLRQRINDFYSSTLNDNTSEKETQLQAHSPLGSSQFEGEDKATNAEDENEENLNADGTLEVRGTRLTLEVARATQVNDDPSPSFKLVQALKHEDFDFDEKCLEVEANLFFSSLWNSFSNPRQTQTPPKFLKKDFEEELEETEIEEEGEGEEMQLQRRISEKSEESEKKEVPVNWCSMLPPQSLSSFLLKKTPYTTRERRKSFQILLAAASKKYWDSSTLKTEFVKWRLPCFMDIPLCEIFLDNPFLLYKYCPDWLKERPDIPDPISPDNEKVVEAGKLAYMRASVVTVSHDRMEVWKLIQDAIEKAEREGMRVSGEIISPGGWVIDNMVLDLDVWCALMKSNVEMDYVYILNDSDPEHSRLISHWYDLVLKSETEFESEADSLSDALEKDLVDQSNRELSEGEQDSASLSGESLEYTPQKNNFLTLLKEKTEFEKHGEKQLDNIFSIIVEKLVEVDCRIPVCLMDVFSHNLLKETLRNWNTVKGDLSNDDVAIPTYLSESVHNIHTSPSGNLLRANMNLGIQLEIFSDKIIQFLIQQTLPEEKVKKLTLSLADKILFFESLLLLPVKLEKIKKFLASTNRMEKIREIDIAGKTPEEIFVEVKTGILNNFIKKPRELEQFEIDEVMAEFERKRRARNSWGDDEFDEAKTEDEGERESYEGEYADEENSETGNDSGIIIYGESGPFCIVNLERNKLLEGKPEFVLRYYGKLYFFWNQEAKNKFIENPEKYAPYYSVIRCLPPLRVFVVGPVGSGKSTICRAIADQCSLQHVDYISMLNFNLIPHLTTEIRKISALSDEHKLLLNEGYNDQAKLIKEIFMKAPYDKKQYWLDNPFDLKEEQHEVQAWGTWARNYGNLNFPNLKYEFIEPLDKETATSDTSNKPPFVSMDQFQSYLSNYIHKQGELPNFCMMKALSTLWDQDPFVVSGFVLEGFPFRSLDIQYMIENNWIPDIIVELKLPDNLVVERNIDQAMTLWEEKLKQEMDQEASLQETLNNIKATLEAHRRLNLIARKRNEAMRRLKSETISTTKTLPSQVEVEEFDKNSVRTKKESLALSTFYDPSIEDDRIVLPQEEDSKIHNEVSGIITQEFKPMSFNPVFESAEAGRARIIADYEKNYQIDVQEIRKIKASLKSINVPWYEVNGAADFKKIQVDLFRELNQFKKRIGQRSEFAFTLSMETAEKLLKQGFYFLSKFGRWCPVQIYRMKNPINMFIPFRERQKITPIAYRNYIYFVGGKQEKINFLRDPVKYVFNEPHNINIPLRIAVIGPPKSGKTTLSERLSLMFSLKRVTMGTAIRFVLETLPKTSLGKSINDYLKRGCFLPLSLKMEALAASLSDPVCVTQGFVLDGIPFDAAVTQSLAEKGMLPFVIISLVCEAHTGKVNREELNIKEFRLPYKQRINLDSRYKDWNETYQRFLQWNKDTYNNVYEVNAKSNVVDIFYEAYDIIRKSYFGILYYVEYCVTDRALPLQYLCVSQHEYELRKSEYQSICPVCWAETKLITCSTDPPERANLVQYLNHFYYVCSEHMKKFIEHPKKYFPPMAPECPKVLPKILSKGVFQEALILMKVHGNGRCPVTRLDFPDSLDWEGSWDHAATYGERVYLCKNEEMLRRFVAQPWKYCFADTEFEVNRLEKSKAVKELEPPVLTSLPPMGFLEQTVSSLIQDALHIVGGVRPVYPNISPSHMACTFVGLYLKVFNKRPTHTHLEIQYLRFMMYHCVSYRYRVKNIRKPLEEEEDEVIESSDDSSSIDSIHFAGKSSKGSGNQSDNRINGNDRCWMDLESPADKKIWSAKHQDLKDTLYRLNNYELTEIIEPPKDMVILAFRTSQLRSTPLPPIQNIITPIYTCKKPLELPEPFNVNTLFQPQPLFPTPYGNTLPFALEKEIPAHLYYLSKPRYISHPNIYEGKRNLSENTLEETKPKKVDETDVDLHFMKERFVPRFHLLDRIVPSAIPEHPKVVEIQPIFYNPHKEYTYTLLMSHYFQTSHLLKCFEWRESSEVMEFSSLFDKSLCLVGADYIYKPKISPSMLSGVSKTSNQLQLEITHFYDEAEQSKKSKYHSVASEFERESSIVNFMHVLILESLNNIFAQVSEKSLSYESFETHTVTRESTLVSEPPVLFREILPYPPLLWDLSSRPYYTYRVSSTIFKLPQKENVVHNRHLSTLDGVQDNSGEFRLMRIPSWVESSKTDDESEKSRKKVLKMLLSQTKKTYFVYDVFDFQWTSFLVYPFSWAYDMDIKDNFKVPEEPVVESSLEEEVVTMSYLS